MRIPDAVVDVEVAVAVVVADHAHAGVGEYECAWFYEEVDVDMVDDAWGEGHW